MVIGVTVVGIDLTDNTVNLAASEGPTSTLMICHLSSPQDKPCFGASTALLSCVDWDEEGWTSGTSHFFVSLPQYAPLGRSELEVTTHQLGFIRDLIVPEPAVFLSLANQLDNLRAAPPEPREAISESREGDGTKDETLKKSKPAETGDVPRKHHRSREEKSQSRHSLTDKSPASSSREQDVVLKADKLGDVVAQACLSVTRMSRVVEKAHNSKMAEALLVRQTPREGLCRCH